MIYALISSICVCLSMGSGMGAATLLRPLLDAVSPLEPASVAILSTTAALGAALVGAFFALSRPISLHQDELLFLAIGALLGGALGELISARFFAMLPVRGALLLQNALLFTMLALPVLYFSNLARAIPPLSITRMASLPAALLLGIIASFLSFGALPLSLMVYHLLFNADEAEASVAALAVALCAMAGKLIVLLIRLRLNIPNADVLVWLLPGTLLGALGAMVPGVQRALRGAGETIIKLSLFTALINMLSAFA